MKCQHTAKFIALSGVFDLLHRVSDIHPPSPSLSHTQIEREGEIAD